MPILANPKHEKFSQGLANGLQQLDAYEAAGYPRSPSSASQLANKEEVRARILELIEDRQRASDDRADGDDSQPPALSFDWLVKMLQKNIQLAQTGGQISAANKAIELLAEMFQYKATKGKKKAGAAPDAEEAEDPMASLGDLSQVMEKLDSLVPNKTPVAAGSA